MTIAALEPRSLFIVALPRSLSTLVHGQACAALGLRSPRWTSAGEILNGDRVVIAGEGAPQRAKFTPPESGYETEQLHEFLDHVVRPRGWAYKDVVQPFAVCRWLPGRPLAALRIRRSLTDVAFSMARAGWRYPERAGTGDTDDERWLAGLARAAAALDGLAAEVVEFDDLIREPETLRASLARLYPGRHVPVFDYIDAGFERRREALDRDRESAAWRDLDRRLRALP